MKKLVLGALCCLSLLSVARADDSKMQSGDQMQSDHMMKHDGTMMKHDGKMAHKKGKASKGARMDKMDKNGMGKDSMGKGSMGKDDMSKGDTKNGGM